VFLAYYLHDLSPFIVEFGNGFGLRWYGLAYVIAFLLGYWLYRKLSERRLNALPPEQVSDFITWAAIFGVMLGGRVGWILFYGLQQDHSGDPWWWPLEVWKGGMSSHGGILGLVLFTLFYARRHRISWTSIGDSLVVVAPIGLGIVRCANFINGELYGKPATVPWAVQFPTELREHAGLAAKAALPMRDRINELLGQAAFDREASAALHDLIDTIIREARRAPEIAAALRDVLPPRHPSQIYEALLEGAVLFAVLWFMRTRMRVPRGVLTATFFTLYALLRSIGEMFRVPDPAWSAGALSAGQFLSMFLLIFGVGFYAWGMRRQEYEPALAADAKAPAP
jgi:phosphatidylglycerol---prolipoprotein diacylglyceryl transferase